MEPITSEPVVPDLEQLMVRYQQADPAAAAALVEQLSPRLSRFFASQMGSRPEMDDMLQELWLRIHRMRHTYRPGLPLLPWAYAIAHRVRIDGYRKRRRIGREIAVTVLPEPARRESERGGPTFEDLVAVLPESQREVLTMLKVEGLSIEEIARATASTAGAIKQRAHRAYERLRIFLQENGATSSAAAGNDRRTASPSGAMRARRDLRSQQ